MEKLIKRLESQSIEANEYILKWIAYHLANASQEDRLHRLLTEYQYLNKKLFDLGIFPLIADYDYCSDENLNNIQHALILSSHILLKDKNQLASQLQVRLGNIANPQAMRLLRSKNNSETLAALRPLSANLRPPGTSLQLDLSLHEDKVWAVTVTPDGRYIISGSDDKTVRVWDICKGELKHTLTAHSKSIWAVAVTPDSKIVVSGSLDNTIKTWDIETGKMLKTFHGHTNIIHDVVVTHDGKYIISSSRDNTIKVWSLNSGKELYSLRRPQRFFSARDSQDPLSPHWWKIMVSPDTDRGNLAGCLRTKWRFSVKSSPHLLLIWDVTTGKEVLTLSGRMSKNLGEGFMSFTLGTKGRVYLAVDKPSGSRELRCYQSRQSNHELYELKERTPIDEEIRGFLHTKDQDCWAVIRTGENAVTLLEISTNFRTSIFNHDDYITSVAITPNGKQVVTASYDRTIKVWNLIEHSNKHRNSPNIQFKDARGGITKLVISNNRNLFLSGSSDGKLTLWDIRKRQELLTVAGHDRGPIQAIAFTPDDRIAITGARDSYLKVWDLVVGKEVSTLAGHEAPIRDVTISPDGSRAVSASNDGSLKLWDIETGKELGKLSGHEKSTRSVVITPDGNYVVSASEDGTVKLWDIRMKNDFDSTQPPIPKAFRFPFSSSRNAVKSFGDPNEQSPIYRVMLTPDGSKAIFPQGHKIRIWDIRNGRLAGTIRGHTDWVNAITISADGEHLIAASWDYLLRVWNLRTLEEERAFSLPNRVNDLTITQNGQIILTVDRFSSVLRAWDIDSRREIDRFFGDSEFKCVVANRDQTIIAGSSNGQVHFWDLRVYK